MYMILVIVFIFNVGFVLFFMGQRIYDFERKTSLIICWFSLRGKNKCEVSFSSCSGYVKKVIKFNESREYTFKLDGDISKGSIHVIVENKNKEPY